MDIFKNKPTQWGLRGDPELWEELSKRFENFDDSKDAEQFNKILDIEFNKILKEGKKISNNVIWFEKFSQSGLSGGSVSIEWWTNKGLPHLKKLYSESLR